MTGGQIQRDRGELSPPGARITPGDLPALQRITRVVRRTPDQDHVAKKTPGAYIACALQPDELRGSMKWCAGSGAASRAGRVSSAARPGPGVGRPQPHLLVLSQASAPGALRALDP